CPWVTPQKVDGIAILDGLTQVATNRPAYFINGSKELRTLATFSGKCWIEDGGTPTSLSGKLGPQEAAFAAAGAIGKSRTLVLSDQSVFINEMMLQTDNDNFDFAFQSIRWLIDRGEGLEPRTHVLFLDEGEVVTNFKVPIDLMDVPTPPIEVVNRLLVKLEQE